LRGLKTYRACDRDELIFGLCFSAFVLVTSSTRPKAFVAHAIVAVFLSVLAIPNRFESQLALSAIYVIGETLILSRGGGGEQQERGQRGHVASGAWSRCRAPRRRR
jgi:hypothetical protein